MPVNRDKPDLWKPDIAKSVDMYNSWFMTFAPKTFRETRIKTTKLVEATLKATENLTNVCPAVLRKHPEALSTLRMCTCPPIAVDRLIGLSGVPVSLVKRMELESKISVRLSGILLDKELSKIGDVIEKMADPDIFVWLKRKEPATEPELHRASTIVADRLCGSQANPIIRNAQEKRQLELIKTWLEGRGYKAVPQGEGIKFNSMPPGTFSFRTNVPITLEGGRKVNIPIDAVVKPKKAKSQELPIFIEAKSAGDFTNVNKRRKEEAAKMSQLKHSYGKGVSFNLFLCGYFDSGYLGYEASEGIDWIWEHRIDDFKKFGI